MTKEITKQIVIILLTCIAIVLILALIFYQFIPSNKVLPAKVQAYSTPESIKTEIEDSLNNTLTQENELYEITDSDLDLYKSNRSYNPGKSDPFSTFSEQSETAEDGNPTTAKSKSSSSSTQENGEKTNNNDNRSSSTDRNTTDNYYTASNVSKGTK